MDVEIHPADWSIPYPAKSDGESVPGLLRPLTCVEHDMEAFPWHLASRLAQQLETPESSFEYLHVTAFFRARAAMLALKGNVLDHGELHQAFGKHRVQAGGIYRKHLLRCIRTAVTKHNLAQLPECEFHPLDSAHDPHQAERNRDMIHRVVRATEIDYLKTLNFISVATDMDEEVARHSVGFWVKGAEMPKPLDVRVRVKKHDVGHDLLPAHDEVKRLIRAGRPVHKIVVRVQEEFAFAKGDMGGGRDGGVKTPDNRLRAADPAAPRLCRASRGGGGGRETTNQRGMVDGQWVMQGEGREPGKRTAPKWEVIGDFSVIRIAGVKKEVNLARKHKARAVVRFIHQWVAERGASEFYVEEVREAFNRKFTGDHRLRRWVSDRFREDLFRGKEKEFDLLFEAVDKMAGRYRVRG